MQLPHLNYLAVLVGGVVIFVLGGLWYSPALFAKRWVALMGKTEEELKKAGASPMTYFAAFLCGLVISFVLAIIINHFGNMSAAKGAIVGFVCYVGFAGATSYANALFSGKPKALWAIDSGYNLVSFVIVGLIHGVWR